MRAVNTLHPSLVNLIAAVQALRDFCSHVVFVGGATTVLYVDQPELSVPRATEDVDCVVEVASALEYYKAEERMRNLGFRHHTEQGAPVCRWKLGQLIVDLMPTDPGVLGFSNQWYAEGFRSAEIIRLPEGNNVRIFSFPYFVASKLEALLHRGIGDLLLSKDLEDILFVMEGRANFLQDLSLAETNVRQFISDGFRTVSNLPSFESAARGNLPRGLVPKRECEILSYFKKVPA